MENEIIELKEELNKQLLHNKIFANFIKLTDMREDFYSYVAAVIEEEGFEQGEGISLLGDYSYIED